MSELIQLLTAVNKSLEMLDNLYASTTVGSGIEHVKLGEASSRIPAEISCFKLDASKPHNLREGANKQSHRNLACFGTCEFVKASSLNSQVSTKTTN
mmetsp:Transcript_2536/g.2753  ORF Transcript_2536/g.2753 Transcript_2536/m.2753 type:complete len:97 (-) Transcript_2536:64-354(-)